MNILDANIGSAKDNMSSPVHNWYKFTAGFSYLSTPFVLHTNDVEQKDGLVYLPLYMTGLL